MSSPNRKPDPYVVGKYVDSNISFGGQSYLWATQNNVECIKKGNYSKIRPIAAEYDLSTNCVYNCPWCAYRDSKNNTSPVLQDDDQAINVIDELSKAGVLLLILTGGGEPLMSKSIEPTIERARDKGISVTLYTNGFLLKQKRAKKIIDSGVCEIRISLNDISCQAAYKTAHGSPPNSKIEYDVVINNLVDLLSARKTASAALKIGVSFVLVNSSARNLDASLSNLIARLKKECLVLDYTIIRPAIDYWPNNRAGYSNFIEHPLQILKMVEKTLESYARFHELGDILSTPQRFQAIVNEQNGPAYDRCLAFQTWLNIGPDGTAYVCCETKHDQKYSLGNILNCRHKDCVKSLMEAPIANHMRDDENSTLLCPTRLCKPSATNILFSKIESVRNVQTGTLPEAVNQWLDDMAIEAEKEHRELQSKGGHGVSGIYQKITG